MMEAFNQHFHGILFSIQDESYYETQDRLSWGVKARWTDGCNAKVHRQLP